MSDGTRTGRGSSARRRPRVAALAAIAAAAASGAALAAVPAADAAAGFHSCGSHPDQLRWYFEAKGLSCAAATDFVTDHDRIQGEPHVVVKDHVFSYRTKNGWKCVYNIYPDSDAQDDEGQQFDCRSGHGAEVRWTDAPNLRPVSLRG